MVSILTIWKFAWVRGVVEGCARRVRLRCASDESVLPIIPFAESGSEYRARRPVGLLPFLKDDVLTIINSGA